MSFAFISLLRNIRHVRFATIILLRYIFPTTKIALNPPYLFEYIYFRLNEMKFICEFICKFARNYSLKKINNLPRYFVRLTNRLLTTLPCYILNKRFIAHIRDSAPHNIPQTTPRQPTNQSLQITIVPLHNLNYSHPKHRAGSTVRNLLAEGCTTSYRSTSLRSYIY